jgi:hypothetical protein
MRFVGQRSSTGAMWAVVLLALLACFLFMPSMGMTAIIVAAAAVFLGFGWLHLRASPEVATANTLQHVRRDIESLALGCCGPPVVLPLLA